MGQAEAIRKNENRINKFCDQITEAIKEIDKREQSFEDRIMKFQDNIIHAIEPIATGQLPADRYNHNVMFLIDGMQGLTEEIGKIGMKAQMLWNEQNLTLAFIADKGLKEEHDSFMLSKLAPPEPAEGEAPQEGDGPFPTPGDPVELARQKRLEELEGQVPEPKNVDVKGDRYINDNCRLSDTENWPCQFSPEDKENQGMHHCPENCEGFMSKDELYPDEDEGKKCDCYECNHDIRNIKGLTTDVDHDLTIVGLDTAKTGLIVRVNDMDGKLVHVHNYDLTPEQAIVVADLLKKEGDESKATESGLKECPKCGTAHPSAEHVEGCTANPEAKEGDKKLKLELYVKIGCQLFNPENMPCQWSAKGACPEDCEHFTPKGEDEKKEGEDG